jgi:hypothetical protein
VFCLDQDQAFPDAAVFEALLYLGGDFDEGAAAGDLKPEFLTVALHGFGNSSLFPNNCHRSAKFVKGTGRGQGAGVGWVAQKGWSGRGAPNPTGRIRSGPGVRQTHPRPEPGKHAPEDGYFLAGAAGAGSRVTPASSSFFIYFSGSFLNSVSQPLQQK